jgi:aminopeptidase
LPDIDHPAQNGGRPAGCCTAALFLKSFVAGVEAKEGHDTPVLRWAHLNIAGSTEAIRLTP